MTFKNYMKKTLNHFIHFTSSHFSLTVKIYVALGTVTLINFDTKCKALIWVSLSAQVTLPTESKKHRSQWDMIDIQSEHWEISIAGQ